jgi:phage tail-like protein
VDVNGTRFHLFLGEDDWRTRLEPGTGLAERGLDYDAARSGVILQRPEGGTSPPEVEQREPFRFPTPPASRPLDPSERRAAACDRYGNWFFIGAEGTEVRLLPVGASTSVTYWPAEDEAPPHSAFTVKDPAEPSPPVPLAGLTVSAHHYLVVGAPSLPGLLAFDLHGGGPPVPLAWPDGEFTPLDLAPAVDGGVWVLDGAPDLPARARLWLLDRHLRVVDLAGALLPARPRPGFRPVSRAVGDDETGAAAGAGVRPGMGIEFTAQEPVALERLPDDSVLVLDRRGPDGPSALLRVGTAGAAPFPFPSGELEELGHDIAFLQAGDAAAAGPSTAVPSTAGRLFVVDAAGNQAFAFSVSARGDAVAPTGEYYPMRMFSGKAIVAAGGDVHYDMGDRWIPLVGRGRRRYGRAGFLVTEPLDSREPSCVWHRLLFDGCVPPGTAVLVEARAADQPELLATQPWEAQPAPYLRSAPEIAAYRPFRREAAERGAGTWELLFQRVTGRCLQLRLSLSGNGRVTPLLAALRVYYPRFSYLREYLPDVYQADERSADFLERYLANVEGLYTGIEGRIEHSQTSFDVGAVDAEFLPWLASWLGIVLDSDWEEARRRLFLRHAVELFRQRGTRRGLVRAIRLAVDACPDGRIFEEPAGGSGTDEPFGIRIVERFLTRSVPGVVFGDPSEAAGPRVVTTEARWTPSEGSESLHARWRQFLEEATGAPETTARPVEEEPAAPQRAQFPPLTPGDPTQARRWRRFVRGHLAVGYDDVSGGDEEAFRAFLTQRYGSVERLNAAWNRSGSSKEAALEQVLLPARLPQQPVALRDWIQFVSIVLPTRRRAHRFAVLVPVHPEDSDEQRQRRIGRVERVVAAEKPSHSAHVVRGYWAALRVGEARVGFETVVGEGSRFMAIVLGRERLGAAYAPGAGAWVVPDRFVVGRERVAPGTDRGAGRKGDQR